MKPVRIKAKLTGSGTGFTDVVALSALKRRGRITNVIVREDASDNGATAGVLYIADHPLTATPPQDEVFYESASIALTGHATNASLIDNLAADGGLLYEADSSGDVNLAMNITAGSGDAVLYVTVLAEVYQ